MTFLQLSYVVAVADEKSISRAAEKLKIAQPSLSRLITGLEREYGLELFKRTKNSVEPTYAGRVFIDHARRILLQSKALETVMHELSGAQHGKLIFGCSSNHIGYLLPPMLHKISAQFPYLEISVIDTDSAPLFRQLANGKVDLVYSHMPPHLPHNPNLQYIPITKEELLLAVPKHHPLAARAVGVPDWRDREPISLGEIADEPFIQLPKNHSIRILTDALFAKHSFAPKVKFEISLNMIAHELSAAGLGVTILPESELLFNAANLECVLFPIEDRTCARQIYISYQKAMYTTLIQECIDVISEITDEIFNGSATQVAVEKLTRR